LIRLFRRRYIAFKLSPPPSISKRELLAMLAEKMTATRGGEDLEQHHIRIIRYDQETGLGIVRCDHRAVDLLLSVLKGSTESFGECSVKTMGTSGSIKALRRRFLSKNSHRKV